MIGTVSPTFTSALHKALNVQLLLFQHAHPEIPVAAMQPAQALDRVLGLEPHTNINEWFLRAVEFLSPPSLSLRLSSSATIEFMGWANQFKENGLRAIASDKAATAEEAMIQGAFQVFEEPLKKVLERFQAAEPVRKNPNDEGAWQVYGDWLLEHDDPRGELIQLTQELKKAWVIPEPKGWWKSWKSRKVRKNKLERQIGKGFISKWGQQVNFLKNISWQNGYFKDFRVEVADGARCLRLFASEEARFLRRLSLSHRCLQLAPLRSVRGLALGGGGSLPAGLSLFVESPFVRSLMQSPHLQSLEDLELRPRGWLSDRDLRLLMASQNLPSLRKLNLSGNRLGDEMKETLTNWARERGIELTL